MPVLFRLRPQLLLVFMILASQAAFAQNCVVIQNLPDTLPACLNSTVQLNPTVDTSGQLLPLDTSWSPAGGLSDPNIINPVFTGNASQLYTLTVTALTPINSVANGNFSSGNTGFTSDYIVPTMPYGTYGQLSYEGTYAVTTNPSLVHTNFASFPDHTGDAAALMMVVNGASVANTSVWCQTITVTPNTDYDFSAWGASCVASNPAILQFQINGSLVGSPLSLPGVNGLWTQFHAIWNSGSNTTITICIIDQQTAPSGNDFAIDDIAFRKICKSSDSVYVVVPDLQIAIASDARLGCDEDTVNFTAVSVGTTAPGSYLWNFGQGTSDTSALTNPTHIYTTQGAYTVTLIADRYGCKDTASGTVSLIHPLPVAAFSANKDTVCGEEALILTNNSTVTAPATYAWSFGDGAASAATDPTHVYSDSGHYAIALIATDGIGCSDTAYGSVVVLRQDAGTYTISDSVLCIGESALFSVLNAANATGLHWDLGDGTVFDNQSPVSHAYYTAGTYQTALTITSNSCPVQVITIPVVVIPPPYVNAGPDTSLTIGQAIRLLAYAPGAAELLWTPVAALSDPNIPNPVASPDVTTTYILSVIDTNGCTNSDTLTVTVLPDGPLQLPTAFTPNGDGRNDVFHVVHPGVKQLAEFRIFNRWGREVFYTADIAKGWDGTWNGVPQDLGVYAYIIRVIWPDGRMETLTGDVTLVR